MPTLTLQRAIWSDRWRPPPQKTSPQPIQRPGLIISAISTVLRIISLLIASLLFSILIEFVGLLLFWEIKAGDIARPC